MEASERDSTAEWRLPDDARPPLISELEARVDEALAVARASESAVMTVGAAALDAAEQARRAADLAERASAEVFSRPATGPAVPRGEDAGGLGPRVAAAPGAPVGPGAAPGPVAGAEVDEDESLREFTARADRIAARLKALEQGGKSAFG